jgi:hypothetical protein
MDMFANTAQSCSFLGLCPFTGRMKALINKQANKYIVFDKILESPVNSLIIYLLLL